MVAFSVDVRSLGSPWLLHAATSAASVRRLRGSSPGVVGMGTCHGGDVGCPAPEQHRPLGARAGGRAAWGGGSAAAHLQRLEVGDPVLLHQLGPVLLGEVADVGHEGGDEQHVPAQCLLLLSEHLHRLSPANVFGRQPPNEPAGTEQKVQGPSRDTRRSPRQMPGSMNPALLANLADGQLGLCLRAHSSATAPSCPTASLRVSGPIHMWEFLIWGKRGA